MDLLMTLASAAEVEANKEGINVDKDEISNDNDSGSGSTTTAMVAATSAATTTTKTKKKNGGGPSQSKSTPNRRLPVLPTKGINNNKNNNNNNNAQQDKEGAKPSSSAAASTARSRLRLRRSKKKGRTRDSARLELAQFLPEEPPSDMNHTDDPILTAAAAAAMAWAKQSKTATTPTTATTTTTTSTTTAKKAKSVNQKVKTKAKGTEKTSKTEPRQHLNSKVQESPPTIINNKNKEKRVLPLVVEQQQSTKKSRTIRSPTTSSSIAASKNNHRKQEPVKAAAAAAAAAAVTAKAATGRSETKDDDDDVDNDDEESFSDDSVYGIIKAKAASSSTTTGTRTLAAAPSTTNTNTNANPTTIVLDQDEDDEEKCTDSLQPQEYPQADGETFQHPENTAIQQRLLSATTTTRTTTASDDEGKIATNLSEEDIRDEDVVFPGRHGSQLPKDKVYTGYVWYKNFLEQQRDLYLQCFTKAQRTALSREIVLIVRKRGGRFFEKNVTTGRYNGMTDSNAIMRTSKKMKDSMDPTEERNRFFRRNHGSLAGAGAAAALAPAGGGLVSSEPYVTAAKSLKSLSSSSPPAVTSVSATSPRMDFKTMTKELSHKAHRRNLEAELAKRRHEHEQTLMMQRMALNREMELACNNDMDYGRVRDVAYFGRRDPMGGYSPDMANMMQGVGTAATAGGFSTGACGSSSFMSPTMYGGIHPYASQMPPLALHSGSSRELEALKQQAAGGATKETNNDEGTEPDGSAKARTGKKKQEGVSKDGSVDPETCDEPLKTKTVDSTGKMDTSLGSETSGPDTVEISQQAKHLWQSLAHVSWVKNELEPETRSGPVKTTGIEAEEFGAVDVVYTGRGGHHEYYTTPTSSGSVRKENHNEEPPPYHRAYFWYKSLIEDKRLEYMTCQSKIHKMKISRSIVDHVRRKGGRFLEKAPNGTYIDVGDSKAQVKTSMFLRDKRSWEELLRKLTKLDPHAAQVAHVLSGAPPNALQSETTKDGSPLANVNLARTTAAAEPNGRSLLGPFADDRHLMVDQNLQRERMLQMALNGGPGFESPGFGAGFGDGPGFNGRAFGGGGGWTMMAPTSLAGGVPGPMTMGIGMGGMMSPSMVPSSSSMMMDGGAGGGIGGALPGNNHSPYLSRFQVIREQAMRQRMEREQMMMMMNRFR